MAAPKKAPLQATVPLSPAPKLRGAQLPYSFQPLPTFCCVPSHHVCVLLLKANGAKRGVPTQNVSEDIKFNCSLRVYWSLRHVGSFEQCFQSSYIKSFWSASVLYWYISYWPNNASWASTASRLANWGQHSFKICFKWIKPFPYNSCWHPHVDR